MIKIPKNIKIETASPPIAKIMPSNITAMLVMWLAGVSTP